MNKRGEFMKNFMVYVLLIAMICTMLPIGVFADDAISTEMEGLTACHPSHDENCGYEVVTTLPCTHQCQQCEAPNSDEPIPPICDCVQLCGEATVNESCLVCQTNGELCTFTTSSLDKVLPSLTGNSLATTATTYDVVYCDPFKGGFGANGSSPSSAAPSLADAVKSVNPNGTIYMMNAETFEYGGNTITIDGKGATVKAYKGSSDSVHPALDTMMINLFKTEKNITLKNITFDGGDYVYPYNFDMIQASYGSLTFGEGTAIQNFKTQSYGAALAVYNGTTVTLDGCTIQNNACGRLSSSYSGGVYVSGNLIFKSGAITNNTLVNGTTASDIYLVKNGVFKLSGNATVGTVVLAGDAFTEKAVVEVTSPLQQGFLARSSVFFDLNGGILLPDLDPGCVVAVGGDGYTLTEEDFHKISIEDSPDVALEFQDSQAVVVLKSYSITKKAMENGDIAIADSAVWGTPVTFSVVPNKGYSLIPNSIKIRQGAYKVSMTDNGDGSYNFNMPREAVSVEAEFVQNIKQPQTLSDAKHFVSGSSGTYLYILELGIDTNMTLDMKNSTVFTPDDVRPNPSISFVLPSAGSGIIRLEGNVITPLKLGETTVQAIARETDTHLEQKQNITIRVVAPTTVRLTSLSYVDKGNAETDGITFLPSKEAGEYGVNESTRSLAYRKVGTDIWKPIPTNDWSWGAEYLLLFKGLEKDTSYELRLTVKDNRKPDPSTAEATLPFSTPTADSINQGGIEGTVTGTGNISITVQKGNSIIASAYGLQSGDKFSFINLSDGFYNLVATNGNYTVTKIVEVKDGKTTIINIDIIGKKGSTVNVETAVPPIAAGGLQELFDKPIYTEDKDATDAFHGGGTVEMRLTAAKPNQEQLDSIKTAAANKTVGVTVDLTVDKIITPNGGISIVKKVSDTGSLIEIAIPLPNEAQDKSGYKVYRYHDGAIDELSMIKDNSSPNTESFRVDSKYVRIYAQKFSAYAIAYDNTGQSSSGGGSSSGGSGYTDYTITATADIGGSITPSGKVQVDRNDSKTFTITPDVDYVIADVLVDGKSVGIVTSYDFEKVMASHTIAVSFKPRGEKDGLPYYVKDGKDVFIGFAVAVGDKMQYLAPNGVQVLLRPNPKQFNDINGHWAGSWIDFVTEREIFVGTSEDMFGPNTGMSRAMFTTVVGRLYQRSFGEQDTTGNQTFSDVDYNSWYGHYLNWCVSADIVRGVGENRFEPNREITRQEMAVMLEQFAILLDKQPEDDGTELAYSDAEQIEDWALSGARFCQQTNIITGREGERFAPTEIATRAEVAVMIQRFITEIMK